MRLLVERGRGLFVCHYELGGELAELDFSDGIRQRGMLLTWTPSAAVLAVLSFLEGELLAVRVAVDVDVGDAHCCGCLVNVCVVVWVMRLYDDVLGLVPRTIASERNAGLI